MKNHCFLRNPKIFLCLLIMFVSGGAHGQTNSLHELMEYLKPDTSIIRNYKDGVSIMYSRSPIYGKRFHYVKSGSTFVTSAVTKVTVTDMEILDDTVYFCGVNLSGNAVIGLFAISDLLASNLTENTVVCTPLSNYTLKPSRLEVFKVSGGLHVVLVNDLVYTSGRVRRSIADAIYHYASNIWDIINAVSEWGEGDNFHCDDVAVSENYILVSGHKYESAGIYLRLFMKPTTVNTFLHIMYSSLNDIIYVYGVSYGPPPSSLTGMHTSVPEPLLYGDHAVWCTHVRDDYFALACMTQHKTSFVFGSTVKLFNVPSLGTILNCQESFLPYGTVWNPKWLVRDVRHDPDRNTVLMLHDADNPVTGGVKSMVTVVDDATLAPAVGNSPHNMYMHSLDRYQRNSGGFVQCGRGYGEYLWWGYNDYNAMGCYDLISFSTTVTNAAFDMFPIGLQYDRIIIKTATTVESVAVGISAIICND